MTDVPVRMGELEVSREAGVVLVSVGLGSCIGVALLDRAAGVAGLAHVMRPGPEDPAGRPEGTFAHHAVPALLRRMEALGARRTRLRAAIAGGAQMFGGTASTMNVGARNDAAVRAALRDCGLALAAHDTGGNGGRTMRVYVGDGRVTARLAGGREEDLFASLGGTHREAVTA